MSDNSNKKERGNPLRRGKACLHCRHLKIKCDGTRPVCGPCQRVLKKDQCEYNDTTSRSQELENTVFRLQSRLSELENTAGPSNYAGHRYCGQQRSDLSARNSPFSASSGTVRNSDKLYLTMPGSQSSPSSENSILRAEARASFRNYPITVSSGYYPEPPSNTIFSLRHFLPHATQFGFFLHPTRFLDAALLPLPFGDERRPSPALLCVAYLWGTHLSQSQPLLSSEPVFLKRAQQRIATEISAHTPPAHVLHTLQAQVLLATYLFRNKCFLEAEFYTNGAATFALGYQLHKIRSARPETSPLLGVPIVMEIYPTPPMDAVEEGERIRGFWAVTCLQSNLTMALKSASASFCILESLGGEIDTPWPLEIADYEEGVLPPDYRGQESIRHFLTDDQLSASPVCMLHAKASILLYRAARLGANLFTPPADFQLQAYTSYMTSYTWLDRRITQFCATLPPIYAYYTDPSAARTLVLTHALTAAAAIKLHRSSAGADPAAQAKCVFAARAILDCLGDSGVPERVTSHPVVGSLCAMACRVLMDEARKSHAFCAEWAANLGTARAPPSAEETAVLADLRAGMGTMAAYAAGSPLIGEYSVFIRW
ncbi:hypothetical protein B0H11DRAFT_1877264 [Mycena galericulata]|nr:hypothetical protein B0H11DRAFT_1877264 [Mycena galericulata]